MTGVQEVKSLGWRLITEFFARRSPVNITIGIGVDVNHISRCSRPTQPRSRTVEWQVPAWAGVTALKPEEHSVSATSDILRDHLAGSPPYARLVYPL